jgi:predicted PurR-regulated permease PerM
MTRKRLYNTLLVLLTLIAAIYLLRMLWDILSSFTDLLLMFGLAWLIAFILRPVARWMAEGPLAWRLLIAVYRRWGEKRTNWVGRWLDPLAVTVVYLALLGLLVVFLVAIIPVVVSQARPLRMNLDDYLAQAPQRVAEFQADLAGRLNVSPELVNRFYKPEDVSKQVTAIVEAAPRFTVTLVSRTASGVGETLLVLALSYYLMLDGQRLSKQIRDLIPRRFQDEYELTVSTIDRAFGGFLRGQVVMAVLSGIVTAIAAGVAGVRYSAIIGAIAGLVMFVPLIGAPIAMFTPSIVALIQGLPLVAALSLLAFLTVFQQILLHFVVPRIMSEAIGMPSLLALVSVLIGVRLWGVWGFIFGIPVAGAVYAVGLVMLRRFKTEQDQLDKAHRQGESPPG